MKPGLRDIGDGFPMVRPIRGLCIEPFEPSLATKRTASVSCQKVWYGDLRFINTPEIQDKIDKVVDRRVEMTLKYIQLVSADFRHHLL